MPKPRPSARPTPSKPGGEAPTPSPAVADSNSDSSGAQAATDKTGSAPRREEEQAEAAPSSGTSFHVDSMEDTAFGIGAQFGGFLHSRPNSVEVEIPSLKVRLHARAYHKGPRRLDSIKVSIGTFDPVTPWKSVIKRESLTVASGG